MNSQIVVRQLRKKAEEFARGRNHLLHVDESDFCEDTSNHMLRSKKHVLFREDNGPDIKHEIALIELLIRRAVVQQ